MAMAKSTDEKNSIMIKKDVPKIMARNSIRSLNWGLMSNLVVLV